MSNKVDEIYIKGFNHAYFLTKYNSQLITRILETSNENIYFTGLQDGKKSFELEQNRNRINEIQKVRSRKGKERGLER